MKARVESDLLRWTTRAGLGANGALYLLMAWLAAKVAFGDVERADQAGALQAVAAEPFGRVVLWLLVAGFSAVVLWRIREAVWGFRYVRDDGERTKKRLFSVLQAMVFTALAVLTVRAAAGSTATTGGQGLTAALLRVPAGRILVVAVGVGVLITGAVMGYCGWRKTFTEDMDLHRATRPNRKIAVRAGQVGAVAKSLAVMIIGLLIVVAALTYRPEQAEGLDAALKALAGHPFGSVLLLGVAAGFACFGVFCFYDARYHRV